jgi:hypothetical protein
MAAPTGPWLSTVATIERALISSNPSPASAASFVPRGRRGICRSDRFRAAGDGFGRDSGSHRYDRALSAHRRLLGTTAGDMRSE